MREEGIHLYFSQYLVWDQNLTNSLTTEHCLCSTPFGILVIFLGFYGPNTFYILFCFNRGKIRRRHNLFALVNINKQLSPKYKFVPL